MRWSSMNKGQLVKQAAQLKPGDQVRTQLGSGEFTSKVERVKNDGSSEP